MRIRAVIKNYLPGSEPTNLEPFFNGQEAIYLPFNSELSKAESEVEVRAFDSAGLVVDPIVFCGYLKEAASDVFKPFAADGIDDLPLTSDGTEVSPRLVIIFSDHLGAPYKPYQDPPPLFPPAPSPVLAKYTMTIVGTTWKMSGDMGDHALLRFKQDTFAYDKYKDYLIEVTIDGEHTRLGLHPHGQAQKVAAESILWLMDLSPN